MTKLSDIGEFGLINRLSKQFNTGKEKGITGIGDDCAVIPIDTQSSWLVTTDMLIEGRHFIQGQISPENLGYKSLAVNLSDIAAMGGEPHSMWLSIGIPGNIPVSWLDDFFSGLQSLCNKTNTLLLGGDTTKSPDKLVINIVVMGKANNTLIKYRSAAKSGDAICITGNPGNSSAGLKALLEGYNKDKATQYLIEQHHKPKTYLKEGQWLATKNETHAMIDISDGIASDIRHIINLSHVGAAINLDSLPVSDELKYFCQKHNQDIMEMAVCGGEDYCLLCTIEGQQYPVIAQKYKENFGMPLYKIGEIKGEKHGLVYLKDNKPYDIIKTGFDHFK